LRREVFVFGGNADGCYIERCEKYSFHDDKWTELKPMAKKKANLSACIVHNKFIYVIAG